MAVSSKTLFDQLNEALDDQEKLQEFMKNNESEISKLSEEELKTIIQKTSYYNNYIPAEEKWALLSVSNWEEEFLRKLTMTSLIGWIYRIVDEYFPDGDTNPTDKAKGVEKQIIIKQFLDRHLNFNPDYHVKGQYKKKFVKRPEMATKTYELSEEQKKDIAKWDGVEESKIPSHILRWDEKYFEANKKNMTEAEKDLSSSNLYDQLSKSKDTKSLITKTVPMDAFYHWKRYTEVNYEELLHATQELYDVLPDLKWSVAFWDSYDTEEKANEAKIKWRDNIKIDLNIVRNNAHTLLGPWKNNQEAIDYHNKNTEILKRMSDQNEADAKMGKEILDNRVKNRKKQNIKETGADDKGLQAYSKALGVIETYGAKPILTKEQREELENAQRVKDDEETPDNAVGVDVFKVEGDNVSRTRIYTKADTPEDVQKQMEAKRDFAEGKIIKGRDGNVIHITDLQNKLDKLETESKNNKVKEAVKKIETSSS